MNELLDAAQAWLNQDPDEETRSELARLIAAAKGGDSNAQAELHSRFDSRLEFGTAGLRGELAAGPNRMNRVLVSQAAAGLAAYLVKREPNPSVVIGYDGRKNSQVFALDTAEIMSGAGVNTILLPRLMPTPVLAFAVRHLKTSAGVMVTASHNPPNDNGYKVYLGGSDEGSQIVPPADSEIEAEILKVAADSNVKSLPRSKDYSVADESLLDEYVKRTVSIVEPPSVSPKFVYTAMHGVGWETAERVFRDAGFAAPTVVKEQIEPDAKFPTVAFPNPEEPGALDLSYSTATAVGAELIIANDPDADRLAIAIPDGDGWRRLTGNEVGSLLGWRAAQRLEREAETVAAVGGDSASCVSGTLACSIVSSPALAEIAKQYHLEHEETLTGFKWVSRVECLAFGYEEALGYLVDPQKVRDKDGISAALEFLALVAELKANGQTVADHLTSFAEKFGAFASGQVSIRVSDLSEIPRMMSRLRAEHPSKIGNFDVTQIDDFATGFGDFAPSDILRIHLADGSRIIIRPSGTEPKLKVYLDASSKVGSGSERIDAARATITALDAAVRPLLGQS
ncbi:MAG: phospho-sugar mutase [Microbacteriaceae bacterium]|nr:phospho-sugar mutase [Microbacteriaceae bacterium]